jgi:hypothetical protein
VKRALRTKSVGTKVSEAELRVLELSLAKMPSGFETDLFLLLQCSYKLFSGAEKRRFFIDAGHEDSAGWTGGAHGHTLSARCYRIL